MKIVVLVKIVPDTYGDRKLSLETGLADRGASDLVLDEISERALELALTTAAAHDGSEVTVLSASQDADDTVLRKALAIGADTAVQIADEALLGADAILTAQALAAAIKRGGYDLVIAGNASTDGTGGVVPAAIAEYLEWPLASRLSEVQVAANEVTGSRPVDGGVQQIAAELPAVISITENLPDARFPNFKSILAAKKKPLEKLSLADLGVDAEDPEHARNIMLAVAEKPARSAGQKITDEGDAGDKIAQFLIENRLV